MSKPVKFILIVLIGFALSSVFTTVFGLLRCATLFHYILPSAFTGLSIAATVVVSGIYGLKKPFSAHPKLVYGSALLSVLHVLLGGVLPAGTVPHLPFGTLSVTGFLCSSAEADSGTCGMHVMMSLGTTCSDDDGVTLTAAFPMVAVVLHALTIVALIAAPICLYILYKAQAAKKEVEEARAKLAMLKKKKSKTQLPSEDTVESLQEKEEKKEPPTVVEEPAPAEKGGYFDLATMETPVVTGDPLTHLEGGPPPGNSALMRALNKASPAASEKKTITLPSEKKDDGLYDDLTF